MGGRRKNSLVCSNEFIDELQRLLKSERELLGYKRVRIDRGILSNFFWFYRKLEEPVMTNTRQFRPLRFINHFHFLLMYSDFPLLPAAALPQDRVWYLAGPYWAWWWWICRLLWEFSWCAHSWSCFWIARGEYLHWLPMNIVTLGFLSSYLLWFGKKGTNNPSFPTSLSAGTVGLSAAMLVLNYVYAVPLYAQFANFDIRKYGLSNTWWPWSYLLTCWRYHLCRFILVVVRPLETNLETLWEINNHF